MALIHKLQISVSDSCPVISFVLIGADFQTIFITSNSASEICGRSDIKIPPHNSYICSK